MSTLASIAYVQPHAYVHIANDVATGTFCVEVSDGRDAVRVDIGPDQLVEIRDSLNKWIDGD